MLDIFDGPCYRNLALQEADQYQTARPFPHIMFDSFLPPDVADDLAEHYPGKGNLGWTIHSNEHADRKFLGDVSKMGEDVRAFAAAVSSRQFLLFLEVLTGIKHLLPDPYFLGGGAMTAGRGDKLDMHVDFNWNYATHCHRRCNALFYLTPDWQREWGGGLRVADENDNNAREYFPFFNRCIIFSTTEKSWHGQPTPITCPQGVLRRVFSAFYYTAASPVDLADPHFTRYHMKTPYSSAPLENYVK